MRSGGGLAGEGSRPADVAEPYDRPDGWFHGHVGHAGARRVLGAAHLDAVIDHVIVGVRDVRASRAFYERALAPLGIGVVLEHATSGVAFGRDWKPSFWLAARTPSAPVHIAFASADRAAVDAFHREALAAGGRDNGAPGLRPQYHGAYYGAFVLDPDGNNVEAVCHAA